MTDDTHKQFCDWYAENKSRYADFGTAQREFMKLRHRPSLKYHEAVTTVAYSTNEVKALYDEGKADGTIRDFGTAQRLYMKGKRARGTEASPAQYAEPSATVVIERGSQNEADLVKAWYHHMGGRYADRQKQIVRYTEHGFLQEDGTVSPHDSGVLSPGDRADFQKFQKFMNMYLAEKAKKGNQDVA